MNLIIIDKQPQLQWLDMDAATRALRARRLDLGVGGQRRDAGEPDVVLGVRRATSPTLETVAAAWWLRRNAPELRVRVVNVVDLMALASPRRASARDERRRGSSSSSPTTRTSSSRSTGTRARFTNSCTGGRTRRAFTCAATARRGRPRRRSTWSCSTR